MSIGTLLGVAHRCRRLELMDQPGLALEDQRAPCGALSESTASAGSRLSSGEIRRLAASHRGPGLKVLDIASGGGDVPIALACRAMRSGLAVQVEGCDLSPQATRIAALHAAARGMNLRFFTLNALTDEIPSGFDVVTSSLFLHHLAEDEVAGLLRRMASAAGSMVLIDDLLRGPFEYAMACAGCRVLSRSPIVRHDGPVSVCAAFTMAEMRDLAARAGLDGIKLTRHWPGRFLLSWSRR